MKLENETGPLGPLALRYPPCIEFGWGCRDKCIPDLVSRGLRRVFFVTAPPTIGLVEPLVNQARQAGCETQIESDIQAEPTVEVFETVLRAAKVFKPEAIVGVGGGSVLDVAKLLGGLYNSIQGIQDVIGIHRLEARKTYLACLPTTSGTGSEVSPNVLLLDHTGKRGIISPHLVPDAAYVDPQLTLGVPPAVTASTGMDALTHCVEAYTNRFAHPLIDGFALQGIRLIGQSLVKALQNGQDAQARTQMALGSLMGGLCLGPVNTAGVHALAYPLGGKFHIAHGVSNALLLSHVMAFNLPASPDRYAEVAVALGATADKDSLTRARNGVEMVDALMNQCGLPKRLRDLGIADSAISEMTESALTVQRLLKNNPRPLTREDITAIYTGAY